ncbi:MAG TPA: DNA primase, partial [Planctomycetaceae bacterium]|nr:DNA primase [Planctomycetaceae bacterium]
ALCPFHDDHNPSFHVYPERQTYRCWACNEGGDCFSWVMKTENVAFSEALRMLAERARLEMPKTARSRSGSGQSKTELYQVLAWAARQFHHCLLSSPEAEQARRYLTEDRGLSLETVQAYGLGYHPRDWQWLLERARGVYRPELLFAARLVRQRRDGSGYRDDFVGRVLFPIRDVRGRTVAFGARVLPGDPEAQGPKYLNSPESILFAKSRLLFGLDLAREAIKQAKTAIVVEGYTDCIAAYQAGIRNVVGTLGTALAEHHVLGLKRWAERVVLVYDGDVAGQTAAERSLGRFLAYDTDLRLLTLPDGQDPAEFLVSQGAEAFRERVDQAEEALEYKLRLEIGRYGLETVRA